MVLPDNWASLTAAQQLFVATNLERTVRGLAPITGMDPALDAVATVGAKQGTDPPLSANGTYVAVGDNWIQGYSNPLEAIYQWVYDDGLGSTNVDCTRADLSSCWEHRSNVLLALPCDSCALGAAFAPTDTRGEPLSFAEVLAESQTLGSYSFTWEDELAHLG